MKMKKLTILAATALLVVACGRNDTLDIQESQRETLHEAVQGSWTSSCEGKRSSSLNFEGERVTMTITDFYDVDCKEAKRTRAQSAKYSLANNYKSGQNNAIVVVPDAGVTVSYQEDAELNNIKNALNRVATEALQTIPAGASKDTTLTIERANAATRELKKIEDIKKGELKYFNRLQLEKLATLGVNIGSIMGLEGQSAFRYELDNGYLILGGGRLDGITNVYSRN